MKIAIYARNTADLTVECIKQVIEKLKQVNATPVVYKKVAEVLKKKNIIDPSVETFENSEQIIGVDFLFSIGGDGTLLDTLAYVKNSGIPILGINSGRLGFLSSVDVGEVNAAIDDLVNKVYVLDERSLLKISTPNNLFGDLNFALNEVTIHKRDSSSMITIHAYLNDVFLNSYWADGLIVSTATGSTAYSLSCGGPIVVPQSETFVVTPIAPHNLNVRPIVISNNDVLTLKIEGRQKHFLVSLDSRSATIESSEEIMISKETFKAKLVRLQNQTFFDTLNRKLMWGIDNRNYK